MKKGFFGCAALLLLDTGLAGAQGYGPPPPYPVGPLPPQHVTATGLPAFYGPPNLRASYPVQAVYRAPAYSSYPAYPVRPAYNPYYPPRPMTNPAAPAPLAPAGRQPLTYSPVLTPLPAGPHMPNPGTPLTADYSGQIPGNFKARP